MGEPYIIPATVNESEDLSETPADRPCLAAGDTLALGRMRVDADADRTTRRSAGNLLALPGVNSNLVPDAHLAALAIEHGLTLCSSDGDFARFPGLRWLDPLAAT